MVCVVGAAIELVEASTELPVAEPVEVSEGPACEATTEARVLAAPAGCEPPLVDTGGPAMIDAVPDTTVDASKPVKVIEIVDPGFAVDVLT